MDYLIVAFIMMMLALICVFGFSLWLQHRTAHKKPHQK